jgi:hypothetical protein
MKVTNPNQMVIPCHAELMPESQYSGLDLNTRLSLRRLVIDHVSPTVPRGPEPAIDDYFNAEPQYISRGLYIHRSAPGYHTAQHAIRLGVRHANAGHSLEDFAVIFPATEYATVARSPHDLGHATVTRTQRARLHDTDQEAARQAALRSAGHMLMGKLHYQKLLVITYADERDTYKALYRDARDPLRTRYHAQNIEKKRALADEKLHETVEVAATYYDLSNIARTGLHKAVRKNLYNGNHSANEFAYNWMRYLAMLGTYTKAKRHKLMLSYEACARELEGYKPYLDAKAERDQTAA